MPRAIDRALIEEMRKSGKARYADEPEPSPSKDRGSDSLAQAIEAMMTFAHHMGRLTEAQHEALDQACTEQRALISAVKKLLQNEPEPEATAWTLTVTKREGGLIKDVRIEVAK